MVLNERKIRILEAIINDYIATAEPIGSRTIAKKYDLGISSATIRNEMSDLEDLGLIIQPHASAGRVPSDKGYRLYVDRLMLYRELTPEETSFLRMVIKNNINQIDYLMQETAKAISMLTNYTTIISEPQMKKTKIKHLQLVPLDENSIVLVLVTDSKVVKNLVINIQNAPSFEVLNELTQNLNNNLQGKSLENINQEIVDAIIEQSNGKESYITPIVNAIFDSIKIEKDVEIYTSGVKNILAFKEFNDIEKAKALFQTLEEKKMLISLLGGDASDTIEIVIGAENEIAQMKDCSFIKTKYKLGDSTYGSIGIIGPTRMDYGQVASILHGIVYNINSVLKALSEGGP